MLSNNQILAHLGHLGFILTPPKDPQKYKVLQLKHQYLAQPIYVKNTDRFPLVIHSCYDTVRPDALTINGVISDSAKPRYFNSNMKEFDKQKNTGKSPEHFGFHFGFNTTSALESFLTTISQRSFVSSHSNQADDSIHTAQNQTERDALIKARVGQHGYRQALLDYWNGCAVTGCTVDSLLIASHIKPWSVDKEARLDVYNGLLLSPTLDLAFDKGLISFDDNGLIILSSQLSKEDRLQLHLDHSLRLRKLASQHRHYLEWHRTHLFKA